MREIGDARNEWAHPPEGDSDSEDVSRVLDSCARVGEPVSLGELLSGRLARRLGGLANDARDLAYRLYAICEQKGWSEEGQMYNLLGDSWPAIQAAAARYAEETQAGLGL